MGMGMGVRVLVSGPGKRPEQEALEEVLKWRVEKAQNQLAVFQVQWLNIGFVNENIIHS